MTEQAEAAFVSWVHSQGIDRDLARLTLERALRRIGDGKATYTDPYELARRWLSRPIYVKTRQDLPSGRIGDLAWTEQPYCQWVYAPTGWEPRSREEST
jgi:hypothetical protein